MKKPTKLKEPDWMQLIVLEAMWYMDTKKRTKNQKYLRDYLEQMKKTIKIVGN